ncbi:MAG TPA: hypothetical protein VGV09_12735, partial [Steroidobacteraceae bacterium]|nr:hypothetical protein [Steroidobacteraceae bacterium]
ESASTEATNTEATGVEASATPWGTPASDHPVVPEVPADSVHPEAQIYFAMNGSEPAVVSQDPYAPPAAAEEPQAAADTALPAPATPAPAPVKPAEPSEPASVEVVFPHDHG